MLVNKVTSITTLLAISVSLSANPTYGHLDVFDDVSPSSPNDQLETVNISLQPAFHAIPIYAAYQLGWFQALGLDVKLSLYPSGGPQIQAAVDDKAWDFGIAGSVPSAIGGQQGILTIGVNNDESATTEVVGAPSVTTWPPTELYNGIFEATKDSTGELLLRKCLDAAGIPFDDTHISYDSQVDIIYNLQNSQTSYGSLWAPNTYAYRDTFSNNETEVFCSGKSIDFPILGGLLVREEFARAKPDVVAKILAAYLRGVTYMQNDAALEGVKQLSMDFHEYAGVPITEKALEEDLFLRPLFNLDEQLDAMRRNEANDYISELDMHYLELEEFLFEHGVIETKSPETSYVTDKYMTLVSQDAYLRDFAYAGAATSNSSVDDFDSSTTNSTLSSGDIAGIVVGVIGALCLVTAVVLCCRIHREKSSTSKVDVAESSTSAQQKPAMEFETSQDSQGFAKETV